MREGLLLRGCYALTRGIFRIAYGLLGLRRSVIRGNLERSFPDLSPRERREIERQFVLRQSELAAEVLYAFWIEPEELRERVRVTNPGILEEASPPRPFILAAAHHCNFEWMLLRISLELGPQLLALYKPMTNQRADAAFRRMRTRFGARLIQAKSVLRELATFRDARAIGLVADQVPRTSPEKHWLSFLGQETAFYMGPELLARALRSRVLYTHMRRLERGVYEVELQPLNEAGEKLPAGELTSRYAAALERDIRTEPAGWWWSHRRWKLKRADGDRGKGDRG